MIKKNRIILLSIFNGVFYICAIAALAVSTNYKNDKAQQVVSLGSSGYERANCTIEASYINQCSPSVWIPVWKRKQSGSSVAFRPLPPKFPFSETQAVAMSEVYKSNATYPCMCRSTAVTLPYPSVSCVETADCVLDMETVHSFQEVSGLMTYGWATLLGPPIVVIIFSFSMTVLLFLLCYDRAIENVVTLDQGREPFVVSSDKFSIGKE